MTKARRALIGGVAIALLMVAVGPGAAADPPTATYEVTIANLTNGQWLTPPLAATHDRSVELFDVGAPAGFGLKEVAENGNLTPLYEALTADRHVADVVIAVAGDPPPLAPGQRVTFEITTERGAKWLSYASMLICTNDGFTGVDALRLPGRVGSSATARTLAYDAGSEINTEYLGDIVPPCPLLTGVVSSVDGSGVSDPALAEGGVVHRHAGIVGAGGADHLVAGVHGWDVTRPVAAIKVTRIG